MSKEQLNAKSFNENKSLKPTEGLIVHKQLKMLLGIFYVCLTTSRLVPKETADGRCPVERPSALGEDFP